MFKKIFSFDKDVKRLLTNIFSLGSLQIANYLLPLLTVPYLVRVLGIENFGVLGLSTAIISYLALFTDYGFNVSATRKIANNRNNQESINETFSAVFFIKFVLMCISFIVLLLLIVTINKITEYWLLYILTFGIVVGQVLFPIWLFQGMEEMKYIAYINLFSRTVFTVCVFIFVNGESAINLVPLFTSIGAILAGVWGLYFARRKFGVKFVLPNFNLVYQEVKDGWYIFTSTIAINSYKTNSILVLGIFSTELIVGYFMIAKKVYEALNGLNAVISQAFLPYVVRTQSGRHEISVELVNLAKVSFVTSFIIFVCTWVFSINIISFIAGSEVLQAINALHYFAVALFFIGINVPAVIYLLQGKNDKHYSKSVLIGAFIDVLLLFFLVPLFGLYGALSSIVITEIFITILLYFYSFRVYRYARV